MHCVILACALVALALISVGTCTKVSPYERYALRSMRIAAEKYRAKLILPLWADGWGGYNYWYKHYNKYDVILKVAFYSQPTLYDICYARASWRNGYLDYVMIYWSCRPA